MCCGARVRIETGLSSARRPSDGAVRRKKTIRVHHPRGRPQGLLSPNRAHCWTPRGPRRRARARLAKAGSGRKRPSQACRRPRHAVPLTSPLTSPAPAPCTRTTPLPHPTPPRLHGRGPRRTCQQAASMGRRMRRKSGAARLSSACRVSTARPPPAPGTRSATRGASVSRTCAAPPPRSRAGRGACRSPPLAGRTDHVVLAGMRSAKQTCFMQARAYPR